MGPYHTKTPSYEFDIPNGRSVIPRRLPPVPSLPSLRSSSSSSSSPSPPNSAFDVSPTTSGSVSPTFSSGSVSPGNSPTKTLNALRRASRPLPKIPVPRHISTSSPTKAGSPSRGGEVIVCRSCMNCVTTSEGLLPASSVPSGSRGFRGFSGKASLFTEVYNVTHSQARVQLMTTGAHTMQETLCANCTVCLGWKIVKAHERSERWKEGTWLLELESLWLARSSDFPDDSPPAGFPQDAVSIVKAARERGLGLEFGPDAQINADSGDGGRSPPGYGSDQHRHHHYSRSHSGRAYHASASAVHLPMVVAT